MVDEPELEARARARLGTVLRDKYRLEAILGIGGMAVVYKATHRNRAEFALKMLHPELCAKKSVRTRFLREGYAANSVKHPGAVKVVDDDVAEDGAAFLVMELLDGISADQLIGPQRRPPSVRAAVAIGLQLLDVLAAAHAAGIVHRDIKPANIFLTRDGTVKVLDFGIARALDDAQSGPQLTGAGMPLGTPSFMAPEQALAKSSEIDARTDIWAAGATLFALLTGEVVHPGEVAAQVLVKAATTPARTLASAAPDVPLPIAQVVDRALAFDKADRWPSAVAMRDALSAACLVGGVEAPDKTAILALAATGTALTGMSDPAAFAATAESAPPEARASASREATSPAVSSTRVPAHHVAPLPRRRGSRALVVLASILALAATPLGVKMWRARAIHPASPSTSASTTPRAPIAPSASRSTVLILELENTTFETLFDDTLGVVLARAIDGSSPIAAVTPRGLRDLATELAMDPGPLDEHIAQQLLARDGGTVVTVRGAVVSNGAGYTLSIVAKDTRSGAIVFSGAREAENASRVVPAIGRLACDLRSAMGDSPPTDPHLAEKTGMSVSLEADSALVLGAGLANAGHDDDGLTHLRRAIAFDPGFALAHSFLGDVLWNMGHRAEARREYELANAASGSLGDLDQLAQLAAYYHTIGSYDRAAALYEEVLEKRPDRLDQESALTDLYWATNQMQRALDLARRVAAAHPRHVLARTNLTCATLRASDVEGTIAEVDKLLADYSLPPPHAFVCLALAEVLRGDSAKAADAYGKVLARDASLANHGLADLAMSEGRVADATALLVRGLADDIAQKNDDGTARKRVLLAEARLRRNDPEGALAAADKAASSTDPAILYGAAEVAIAAGGVKRAHSIAADLGKSEAQDARMYAKLVEADALRAAGKAKEALAKLDEAQHISDSWLGHVSLARAHLDLGENAEAERELRVAIARRGEGSLAFDPNAPSARLVPPLTYYLARALEGQGRPEAKATYEAFLAFVPGAEKDPLADDARRRLAKAR